MAQVDSTERMRGVRFNCKAEIGWGREHGWGQGSVDCIRGGVGLAGVGLAIKWNQQANSLHFLLEF